MNELGAVLVLAMSILSCVTPVSDQAAPSPSTDSPCPSPNYSEWRDGSQVFQLVGRFVTRDQANVVRVVRDTKLLYLVKRDDPDAQPLELIHDSEGGFAAQIMLPWSAHLLC